MRSCGLRPPLSARAPISKQEDVTGAHRRPPQPGESKFDERWVALVMLAKLKNSGTRNGYRIDVKRLYGLVDAEARPAAERRRSPAARHADRPEPSPPGWRRLAATRRLDATSKIAVVPSFYALAERHGLIVRTPLIGVSRPQVDGRGRSRRTRRR